jgi:glycosyltransferase involved in cell wall biosynthesis
MSDPAGPRVSCIIAVYNGEAYLHEAIDSLRAQDYPNIEIVVVDDGSTDGTPAVLHRYGQQVRVLTQTNRGVSTARNRGVEASTGDLLCFLDADDRLDPRKISLQVACFHADPQLNLCDCHSDHFWSPEIPPESLQRDPRYAQPFWRTALPGHISTWLIRRDLWDLAGGFAPDLRFAEDVDWFSRARDHGMRRHTLPDVLTHRRLHPRNVTARRNAEQSQQLADALKAHLTRMRTRSAR